MMYHTRKLKSQFKTLTGSVSNSSELTISEFSDRRLITNVTVWLSQILVCHFTFDFVIKHSEVGSSVCGHCHVNTYSSMKLPSQFVL